MTATGLLPFTVFPTRCMYTGESGKRGCGKAGRREREVFSLLTVFQTG